MVKPEEHNLVALLLIVDYSGHDLLCSLFREENIPLFLLTHGYGSAESDIYDVLGYGGPKKMVFLSIQTGERAAHFLNQVHEQIDFRQPGTGIACTLALSSISQVLATICQQIGDHFKEGSAAMVVGAQEPYHLILTIVNSGHFEEVMKAAKSAGATGGTLIHARGLGTEEAIKYLGITIQPEKDLVLILINSEKRKAVMENIILEVGLNTEGMGICFSLPVNEVWGSQTLINQSGESV